MSQWKKPICECLSFPLYGNCGKYFFWLFLIKKLGKPSEGGIKVSFRHPHTNIWVLNLSMTMKVAHNSIEILKLPIKSFNNH